MNLARLLEWTARPDAGPRAARLAAVALGILAVLEIVLHGKGYFAIQSVPGFSAWFGVLACAGLALAARLIGVLLQREDEDD